MRLVTMNIWGLNGDWPARRDVLRSTFGELEPDVLNLQETVVTDDYDQVRDVIGAQFHIAHSRARAEDGLGASIASRRPFTAIHELDQQVSARTVDFPCTSLIAEIDDLTGPVLLVNHFPSWKLNLEAERCEQAVIAAEAIENFRPDLDAPVVVAGDMDADPDSSSVRFWTGRHQLDGFSVCYRDAWEATHPGEPGHTYTPANPAMVDEDWPFRRIDYVLVRCAEHGGPAVRIEGCDIILESPRGGTQASDHYGLVADLQPKPTPAEFALR